MGVWVYECMVRGGEGIVCMISLSLSSSKSSWEASFKKKQDVISVVRS